MRIGIIGAGAIGGWIGIRLAAAGHDVSVLARGNTLAAISSHGWQLSTSDGDIIAKVKASNDPRRLGEQDLLVIALKGPALPRVAPSLTPMIGDRTAILPAMNGVPWWFLLGGAGELAPAPLATIDPSGAIARSLPFEKVIGCVVHASAVVGAPGHVTHKAGNRLIVGGPTGGLTPAVEAVANILEDAGFEPERSQNVQRDIWYKLWGNMTMNPISAITGATCDRILDDELVHELVNAVMREASEIGTRIDCAIEEGPEERNAVTRKLGAFKTSMLQDVEAQRELEIDQLLSAPREIAGLLGLATPNIDGLLGLTRLFAQSRGLYGVAA